jgi:hypothetical protein
MGPPAERKDLRHTLRELPSIRTLPARFLILGVLLFLTAGCGSRGSGSVPRFSPGEASQAALAEYDANKDGFLDAKELERCPALKRALKAFDKNGDGRLSADEIAERLARYQQSKVGLMPVTCQVSLDGRALEGATVTFEPEKFLGPSFKPASGVSDKDGSVELKVEGGQGPGVPCGLYRVVVSKKNASGRESVPDRYNAKTTLGEEVAPDLRGGIALLLTSN